MTLSNEERYYNIQFKWKALPLKTDNLKNSAFYRHVQTYASILEGHLPAVPETLPLCQLSSPRVDNYNSGGAERLDITSYILEPQYWMVQLELDGEVIGGNDVPEKYTMEETGTEEWTLDGSIELEGSAGVDGSYGVLKYSAEVRGKAGASWSKKVTTTYKKEREIDGTKTYQAIKLRPRLVSKVKSSYRTSLLIDPKRFGIAVTREGDSVSDNEKIEQNSKLSQGLPNNRVATAAEAFGKTYSFHGEPHVDEGLTWKVVHHFYEDIKVVPRFDGKVLVWYKRHKYVWKYPYLSSSDEYAEEICTAKNYALVDGVETDESKLVHDFDFGKSFKPWKVIAEVGGGK
ncbi:hypothetical protein BDV36DRAFT_298853 [Aspergillus pseudocaelatus]|uniref:Uncharacterized protein n=1 Tax=Aspergillus pseudocaelatus TaxID=1825620 RepID=A0ABQ6WBW6_9EURO|nr:hypothetical protein BDV36DRAFT_298853 [Aspergillus pseudocaelatus]